MIKRRAAPPPPADRGRATDAAAATPAAGTPWLVWHRAGDNQASWRRALASSADYLEIDVWLQGRRIASHHDPLLHRRLPFLTQQHRLPRLRLPGRGLWLDDADARGRVFLDIKDPRPEALPALLRALDAGGSRDGAVASTPHWAQLDRLVRLAPDIGRFYTLPRPPWQPWRRTAGDPLAWTAYQRRMADRRAGAGVSLHRDLATPERLGILQAAGLRAICYPINDFQEGRRLLRWGAGGLTSDRAGLIQRWRDQWARGD